MNINHGTAVINEGLLDLNSNIIVEKGEEGIVTAYLPEMDTFAVMFTNNRWFTFKESEELFLKQFT